MKINRLLCIMLFLSVWTISMNAVEKQVKSNVSVNGTVTDMQKHPIADVVVCDGVNFTQTDSDGRYRLLTDTAQSKFVYLSVPADYKAVTEHALPIGYYARINAKRGKANHDFHLVKRERSFGEFTFVAISDPQFKNKAHLARYISETLPDLKRTVEEQTPNEVYGMVLGDVVWDAMDMFAPYKEAISDMNLTMYHTIGNHDFDRQYSALNRAANKGLYGEHAFGDHFGPTDYSFNVGKVHVIAMKDIDYEGNKKYTEQFTPEQLEWLKRDLSYVEPGTVVFLNLHAPVANRTSCGEADARNAEELFEILKNYKTHVFSGHTHFYENRIVTPDFYEHNIGAACGAWWAGDVNRCGAPNGYLVVNVNGNEVSWRYKSTGHPDDYQFRIYKPGEFQSQPEYLVVNVWDYDPAWELHYYEDGVEKAGVLEAFDDEDQDFITMKEGKAEGYHTMHLFRVRPTKNAAEVKVMTVNRFGIQSIQTIKLL